MSMLQNALSGALAAQIGLDTTSQNVANLATAGYTRQGVNIVTLPPSRAGAAVPGEGVTVPSLIRFSDAYKSLQLWQAASDLAQRSTAQPYLTQLEQVMGDDSSSISGGLDGFFSALNAASVEPASAPLRQQVITSAGALAQRFDSLQQVLSNQGAAIGQQRSTLVTQAGSLASDIALLNAKIASAGATGVNPSGLMDARDQKIDALASIVSVQVTSQPDGSRSVSLRGGQPLVVGSTAATMRVQTNADGSQTLKLDFAKETFTLPTSGLGGQLGGLDDMQQNVLAPLAQSVSDMAEQISTQVNAILATGFGSSGNAGPPLFVFDASSTSAMLTVTPGLLAEDLGFSSDATQPGLSDKLIELIDLQHTAMPISSLGNVQLGDAYSQLVGQLATDSQQNQASLSTAQTVRDQAEQSWKSTSGVNQDEEAINLLQYQQMYQANMKVLAVAGQLFDSTLAMFN